MSVFAWMLLNALSLSKNVVFHSNEHILHWICFAFIKFAAKYFCKETMEIDSVRPNLDLGVEHGNFFVFDGGMPVVLFRRTFMDNEEREVLCGINLGNELTDEKEAQARHVCTSQKVKATLFSSSCCIRLFRRLNETNDRKREHSTNRLKLIILSLFV